ncbi:lambda-crystallin-like [Sycon ciliatum]|uniref:lambda-crystallin-like n=1 Tax=Sycon ciliatum TaxID=27933 RepID=UPI0020ACC02B|eukprot:scpid82412/ scgid19092/ Lambda-crystallin homolog; L-gulonate 3-dehydrogenase
MSQSHGKVVIVGSGLIGRCWAVLFARAGHNVTMYDIDEKQLSDALVAIRQQVTEMHQCGSLGEGKTVDGVCQNVRSSSDLATCLQGALHVQECVPEIVDLKKKVFSELDKHVDEGVVMASSSSCIVPSSFTESLRHRSQCIVAHPVNPPQYIPLVEIVPAPWTAPEIVKRTRDLMQSIGQAPVTLNKEVNGFLLNRLQYALIMEGWRLVQDGVCTPEDVDTAVSQGLGLRYSFMGPFEVMHLNAEGIKDYCDRYGANITRVCETQCSAREMPGTSTCTAVHEAMCRQTPVEDLPARRQWRDTRLAALAAHKQELEDKEKKA